jgi:hypothetical protein
VSGSTMYVYGSSLLAGTVRWGTCCICSGRLATLSCCSSTCAMQCAEALAGFTLSCWRRRFADSQQLGRTAAFADVPGVETEWLLVAAKVFRASNLCTW